MSDTTLVTEVEGMEGCVEYPFPQMLPEPEYFHYYSDMANRIFWIENDIDDTMSYIIKNIISINQADAGVPVEDRNPIYICINCDGGESDMMWSLIDAINTSATPVTTINMGRCYSAAALIFIAGHVRLTMPSATFMIHDGSGMFAGDFAEVGMNFDRWVEDVRLLRDFIIDNTDISAEDLDDKLGAIASHMGKDWFIRSTAAIDLAVADAVIESLEKVFA